MKRITHIPAESDDDNALRSISDTETWPDWNGDLHNSSDS